MYEGRVEQTFKTAEQIGLNGHLQPTNAEMRALVASSGGRSSDSGESGVQALDFMPDIYKVASNDNAPRQLQGHLEAQSGYDQFKLTGQTDASGENPFGGKADKANPGGAKPNLYLCLTLELDGVKQGGKDVALINVNIPDTMKVAGKSVTDGNEHRDIFPLVPETSSPSQHWHWIDASLEPDKHNNICLVIHRVSPSLEKPTEDKQWDQVEKVYPLQTSKLPMHPTFAQYQEFVQGGWTGVQPQWSVNAKRDSIREMAVERP